ncbi:MAG: 2Fe-2S iron-sulfur cluster binding domain-containing protein, partial [Deltaproteobacteria bacterium]|nr:2Fe-2S iron-sulfur cluster binding domain-containing protein [Deltaproteobacteria bacterium]
MRKRIELTVNGEPYELEVEPRTTLVKVIREEFGLTGTKSGCERGECGSCTVLMDGIPVNSCLIL